MNVAADPSPLAAGFSGKAFDGTACPGKRQGSGLSRRRARWEGRPGYGLCFDPAGRPVA